MNHVCCSTTTYEYRNRLLVFGWIRANLQITIYFKTPEIIYRLILLFKTLDENISLVYEENQISIDWCTKIWKTMHTIDLYHLNYMYIWKFVIIKMDYDVEI